jgi:hypothetical protein
VLDPYARLEQVRDAALEAVETGESILSDGDHEVGVEVRARDRAGQFLVEAATPRRLGVE